MLCTSGDLVELRLKPTNPSVDRTARFGVAGAIDPVSDALKVRNQHLDLLLLSTGTSRVRSCAPSLLMRVTLRAGTLGLRHCRSLQLEQSC